MHRKWLLLALCAAACRAQPPGVPADAVLLARIRGGMEQVLNSQPNYTCSEYIERAERRLPRDHAERVDVLRLEVALVDGKELYAWPGSKQFDDTALSGKIASGAIADGNFAMHARAIFSNRGPVFRFKGREDVAGRRAIRFDYEVPPAASGFRLVVDSDQIITPYRGSFWADSTTLDLIRLEIIADQLPDSFGLRRAAQVVDYQRVRFGPAEFLLPSHSDLVLMDRKGTERRNVATFSACRQFSGTSAISFTPVPENAGGAGDPPPVQAEPSPETVPANLLAEAQLETEIDSAGSATGDLVQAHLRRPLRQNNRVLLPSGATLLGRIIRLERRNGNYLLDVQFTEGRTNQSRWNLVARIHDLRVPETAVPGFGADGLERMFPKTPRRIGTISISGTKFHLSRGVRMTLRTEKIAAGPHGPAAQENQ